MKITKFHGLDIAEARTALAYAMSVLSKQSVHIKTAIIVQTQKGDTSCHRDIFSVCTFSNPKRVKGDEIQVEVTLFSENEKAENVERTAVIGDYGQWILESAA